MVCDMSHKCGSKRVTSGTNASRFYFVGSRLESMPETNCSGFIFLAFFFLVTPGHGHFFQIFFYIVQIIIKR